MISTGFKADSEWLELRISPKWVTAILIVAAVAFTSTSDPDAPLADWMRFLYLTSFFYAGAAVVWALELWKPAVSRWGAIAVSISLVFIGLNWFHVSGFLGLIVFPVILAAALISLFAATITSVIETVLLLYLANYTALEFGEVTVLMSIMAIWAGLVLMSAIYRPVYHVTGWSWEHFQRVQNLLEESRDRKAELEQALNELMRANWQLDLLNEKLTVMRRVAEEAQNTKAAFVAKVSHEFRTPLNMIIGMIDVLVETPEIYGGALPPALLEDLNIVHRNCEHLSAMVNDVLDLSQTEAGYLTLRREWVNLAEDVEAALKVVSPLLQKKGLSLLVSIPDNLPEIFLDRTRIRQVLLNLVSNAARFTDKGGITVEVVREKDEVVISVTDTGPGIRPEDANRIFEPFGQGTSNPWRNQDGTGLGLSISKQFVELHNGQIWLKSELGVGSTFSFKIPIGPSSSPSSSAGRWVSEDWVWTERTVKPEVPRLPFQQRIIVCDDTTTLPPLLHHYADRVELVETTDLDQTLEELRRCPAHAVLLNSNRMDNLWSWIETARQEIPDTPIFACSFPPLIEHAVEAGAVDYLLKPLSRLELEKAIQAVHSSVNRVLIADDNPDIHQLLNRMLTTYTDVSEIINVSNGQDALAALRNDGADLLLLDIMLPDIDGWQILKLKDQDEAIKDIPVIIISAQDPAEQTITSKLFMATIGPGISVNKLLHCSAELSKLLLQPD